MPDDKTFPGQDVVMQVCFVTDDLDATIARFSEVFDKAPVFIGGSPQGGTSDAVLRGKDVRVSYRQTLFRFDNIDVEFIEPGPEPSTWRETLDAKGPGFHHIAIGTRNMTRTTAWLGDRGLPMIQTGDYESRDGRYAYLDGAAVFGGVLELLESFKDREAQP